MDTQVVSETGRLIPLYPLYNENVDHNPKYYRPHPLQYMLLRFKLLYSEKYFLNQSDATTFQNGIN